MIDRRTGLLVLPGLTVGPQTTLEGFLAGPKGRNARPGTAQGLWRSFAPDLGPDFGLRLYFEDQRLAYVHLALAGEGDEGEGRRRHAAWLRETSGMDERERLPWGEVDSVVDAKGAGAVVVVTYAHRRKWWRLAYPSFWRAR